MSVRRAPLLLGSLLCVCLGLPAAGEEQRAILDLEVNLAPKGTVIVHLRLPDVLIRVADLEEAGVRGFAGERQTIAGEIYVSLASLAPDITFELDETALALRLTAQPQLFSPTIVNLRPARPPGLTYLENTSAFLNYAFTAQDFERVAAFAETGFSFRGHLFLSTLSRDPNGDLLRGATNLTLDDRGQLRRWVIGDSFAAAGTVGGGLSFGGLSVSRNFGLDPYWVRYPTPALSGSLLTPSTLEIYINGTLVRSERLPPGPFELTNLPVFPGRSSIRLIIRDAFGREQEISSLYYFSTGILAQGVSEYSYNFGLRRNRVGAANWDYGPLAFLGSHRFGLSDSVTAGFHFEATPDLVSGGPTLTTRLLYGEVELATAASHKAGLNGAATTLAYTYTSRGVSFGGSLRALTSHWSTLSLEPDQDRALLQTNLFTGFPLGRRLNMNLQYAASHLRDKGKNHRVSFLSSLRLTRRISLTLSGARSRETDRGPGSEVLISLALSLGNNTSATLSHQQRADAGTSLLQIQKPLPTGPGFGYRVQTQLGGQERITGIFQYQSPYGRYEATFDNTDGRNSTTLSVSGAVVAIGPSVYLARPVQDSFALIRVPGLAGVHGYVNNQSIGRTNGRGDLFLPNLLPYYGNRLSIEGQDIPLDYNIEATEKIVAPPFRGGAVVFFPVQRLQALTGAIVIEVAGQTVVPAYGQLTVSVNGRQVESPLGKQGEFYLENVPAGRYPAQVDYEGGTCRFELDVPASQEPLVDLGAVRCVVPARTN